MNARSALIAGILSSLTGLLAQQGIHLPQDPVLLIELDGPASLRGTFAKSNLLRMLDSPEAQEIGIAILEELSAEDMAIPANVQGFWESFAAYEGRLRIGLHVVPVEDSFLPSFLFTLEMGHTDRSGRKALMQLIDGLEGNVQPLVVQDERLSVFSLDGVDLEWTTPTLIDGKQVTIIGQEIVGILPEFLSSTRKGGASTESSAFPISARFDVPAFMDRLFPENKLGALEGTKSFMEEVGLASMKPITASIVPAGQHILITSEVAWDPTNPGFMKLLYPDNSDHHGLLSLVPRTSLTWALRHMDFSKGYEFISLILEGTPLSTVFPGLLTGLNEQIRMNLKDDLLAHLGNEVLILGSGMAIAPDPSSTGLDPESVDLEFAQEEEQEWPELSGDTCVVISLVNEKALAISLEKLIRSRGLHVARRRSEHRGTLVQTIPLLGTYQISYSIADGLLLIAHGEAGLDSLHAVLDMSTNKRIGKNPPEFSRLIRDRLSLVDDRWQDLASTSFATLFSGPEYRGIEELMNSIIDLLKKYDLHVVLSATNYEDAKAKSTAIW